MKRVIIPIENYELDDYKTHKDGMKDYAYLILLISRKLISFPYLKTVFATSYYSIFCK